MLNLLFTILLTTFKVGIPQNEVIENEKVKSSNNNAGKLLNNELWNTPFVCIV